MSIRRLAQVVGVLFLVSAALAGPGTAAMATPPDAPSVGAYPTVIHFDQALRGGEYVDTFGVLNSTGSGEYFSFGLAGATAPWLHVVSSDNHSAGITKVWAPGGPRPSTAVLELQVPPTLANGIYQGELTVASVLPKVAHKNQTPVGLGAAIDVVVDVTGTEVVAGALVNVYTTYPKIEVGSPVNVFVVVKNAGNVAEQPAFAASGQQGSQQDGPIFLARHYRARVAAWPDGALRGGMAGRVHRDTDSGQVLGQRAGRLRQERNWFGRASLQPRPLRVAPPWWAIAGPETGQPPAGGLFG